MQQQRQTQLPLATASSTATQVQLQAPAEIISITLQPTQTAERPQVRFDESIIDNEHSNKKKSKICCIYRKPYDPNCSSSESDSGDEREAGNSYDVQPKKKKYHAHCSY